MDFASPVTVGILCSMAVFCLLTAYYLKSDYLRDNFLKMKEKESTWYEPKKGSREQKITDQLKSLGSKKTYHELNQQATIIAIAISVAIIVTGMPIILIVLAAVLWYKLPDIMVAKIKEKRMEDIQNQLGVAIDRIQQVLNVGGQMSQGFEEVANECPQPIAGEFKKICIDINTGAKMEDALENLYSRCPLSDIKTLSVGISIADTVSKEVAVETLSTSRDIIYRRKRQEDEVKALIRNGQIILYVLTAAPGVAFVAMWFLMNNVMEAFINSFLGMVCILVAVVLNIAGFLIGRKITSPKSIINY